MKRVRAGLLPSPEYPGPPRLWRRDAVLQALGLLDPTPRPLIDGVSAWKIGADIVKEQRWPTKPADENIWNTLKPGAVNARLAKSRKPNPKR